MSIEVDDQVKAYPVGRIGDAAVNDKVDSTPVVIFSSTNGPAGNVFSPVVGDQRLDFEYRDAEQTYFDLETETMWDFTGRALIGELAGEQLEQIPSRASFWFSYADAYPGGAVYLSADE